MSLARRLLVLGLLGGVAGALPSLLSARGTVRAARWPDGTPRQEVTYEDGLREGPAAYWYEDGTLRARGSWLDDERDGRWDFYLADGRPDPQKSGTYDHGQRVAP